MLIMSFNVRGAYWEKDGVNFWPHRSALNVSTIQRAAPDVIGFQEFQDGNMQVYHNMLSEYQFSLGPHYGNGTPFEYPAIAWRPERFRLAAAGGFWLSTTPRIHSEAWDTACIRSAQWVRLQAVQGGATFVLLNTHLDHISAEAQLEGAKLIVAQLAELAAPDEAVVITGDFNCDPDSPPYEVFRAAGYADTFTKASDLDRRRPFTFHGFHGNRHRPHGGRPERIDWILARGLMPTSFTIVRDAEPPLFPSDHFPVTASLEAL